MVEEKREVVRLKGPTDHKNPEFEEYLKTRTSKDFIAEQDELLGLARADAAVRAEARREEDALDGERYMYSTQRLAYTEVKKEQMRQRLSKEKNCTYTYSQEFTSQTVSMVDAERLAQVELADSKAHWKTSKGFVYPAPRKTSSYAVHPNKPSQSRIDILGEEWVENEMHPEDVKRVFDFKPGQVDFNTVPSNGKGIFGGFDKPAFERELVSEDIGNSRTLPRGKILEVKNKEFFNSVHLCGEAEAVEEQSMRRQLGLLGGGLRPEGQTRPAG